MGTPCTNCIDATKLGCGPTTSDNVTYTGPNLPCSTINTKDTLTIAFQKIDALLCNVPGGQDLQQTLINGNISTDNPALFGTSANTNLTTISFNGVKVEDSTKYVSYTKEGIFFSINGTTIKPASPGAGGVNLLVPTLTPGTYTIATVNQIPNDANLLHKTGDEIKTGDLTVNAIIKAGGDALEYLMADGSTSTISGIITSILTPNILDGDTTHAPTGNAVYDALILKEDVINKINVISGSSSVDYPTENAVVNYVTNLDSNALHKSGDELFTGIKSANNIGNSLVNGLSLTNNGTTGSKSFLVTNLSSGDGISVVNPGSGKGVSIDNSGSGSGLSVISSLSGRAIEILSTSTAASFYSISNVGDGIISDTADAGYTGKLFVAKNLGVNVFTVDKFGEGIFSGNVIADTPTLANHLTTKAYVDGLVAGLLDLRGSYDASSNLFPTTGGSGTAGAVLKGDFWFVSVPGILGGQSVPLGSSFFALVDAPGQTAANWALLSSNIGYVPANDANVIHTTLNETKNGSLTIVVPGGTTGLQSTSISGWGVYGASTSGLGVYGSSSSGVALRGLSATNVGLQAATTSGLRIAEFEANTVIRSYINNVGGYVITGGLSTQFLKADGTLDSNAYATTLHATTHISGGSDPIAGQSLAVTLTPSPLYYSPINATLQGHLLGIDQTLGTINQTTAGISTRVYFTGDNTTVTAGTFFTSNTSGKGATAAGTPQQTVVNGDNIKQFFAKDIISVPIATASIGIAGAYSGQLTISSTPTPAGTQQRFTIEVYKTNNGGTPIASGVTGAPVGDLGVTVVAILDSGLVNVVAGSITNISLSGNLASQLTLNVGERLRYHVSAAKVGTGGGNVTMNVYYGTNYNSYYDVPVILTTDVVLNKSLLPGITTSDVLNSLDASVVHKTGNLTESINGNKTFLSDVNIKGTYIRVAPAYTDVTGILPLYTGNTPEIARSATFYVNSPVTLANLAGWHTYGAYSTITQLNNGASHASFDSKDVVSGAGTWDHFIGFQSRPTFEGSNNITALSGATFFTVHNGLGTVAEATGLKINTFQGTGVYSAKVGVKIDNIGTGPNDYSIYTGTTKSRLGGDLILASAPTTSAGTYDILTRNTSTGVIEKILSTSVVSGSGTSGQVSFWNSTNSQTGDSSLFWDNVNKRLGIGTSTPVGKLDIFTGLSGITTTLTSIPNGTISFANSGTSTTVPTIIGKSDNSVGLSLQSGVNDVNTQPDMQFNVRKNDNTDLTTLTTSAFRFSRFATTLVDILRNGNVGIGTNSPASKLDIIGTQGTRIVNIATDLVPESGVTMGQGIAIAQLGFGNGNGYAIAGYNVNSLSNTGIVSQVALNADIGTVPLLSLQANQLNNAGSGATLVATRPILGINNFTTRLVTILANGLIGIGFPTPTYNLQLNSGNTSTFMHFTSTSTGTTSADGFIIGTGSAGEVLIINRENTQMVFHTNNTEKMRIAASGGVSIGNVTDPGASNLFVTGNIGAGVTPSGTRVQVAASTTSLSAIRLTVGVAPTTPADGDIWLEANTLTGLKIRIAGVTRTVTLT